MKATQYVVLGVFIFFLIVGVIIFAAFGTSENEGSKGISISMWGIAPEASISKIVEAVNGIQPGAIAIDYEEISPSTFEFTLTEALAAGQGPDVVIIPHYFLLRQQNKLALIPFSAYPESTFKQTFVEAGEVFLTGSGIYALPFLVDPLVMYWNRDMFNTKGISTPPSLWAEMPSLSEKLTQITDRKVIVKSALPFGEYQNVSHAKEIISALTFQAGNPILKREGNAIVNTLNQIPEGSDLSSFDTAVSFYTQFSDPLKSFYSWNRSLPTSEQMFLSDKLAMYFGFASELNALRAKNPNLNFGIAPLPQAQSVSTRSTYGNVYGLAIVGNSPNKQQAFDAIKLLSGQGAIKIASDSIGLPPVRRDLLSEFPGTEAGDIFWRSALWSKAWLDPNPIRTGVALKNMLESITSGQSKFGEATRLFADQLDEELR